MCVSSTFFKWSGPGLSRLPVPSLDLATLPSDFNPDNAAMADIIPADGNYCLRTSFETQVCKIAATQFPEDRKLAHKSSMRCAYCFLLRTTNFVRISHHQSFHSSVGIGFR